ncbi:hypothetical protein K439DRAFT_1622650 [Ramaria rubella]|nr:hypothetical protein K439DRAFT_1622650 [Ramaria rubella]
MFPAANILTEPLAHPQVPISEVHMPKLPKHEPRFQEAPASTQSRGAWSQLESPMCVRQVTNSSGQLPMSPPPPINRCTRPHTNKGSKEKAIWGGSISPSHMDPAQAPQEPSGTSINQIKVTTRSKFHPARHIDINFQQDSSANGDLGNNLLQTSTKRLHRNESPSINISMRPESQMKPADLEEGPSVQALPSHADDGNHMHVDEVNSLVSSLHFLGLDEDNNERAGVEGQSEKRDFSQFLDSIDECLKLLELLPELFERGLPELKSRTKSEDENSYNNFIQEGHQETNVVPPHRQNNGFDMWLPISQFASDLFYNPQRRPDGGRLLTGLGTKSLQFCSERSDVFVTEFKTQHLAGEFLGHDHWNDKWLESREIKAHFSQWIRFFHMKWNEQEWKKEDVDPVAATAHNTKQEIEGQRCRVYSRQRGLFDIRVKAVLRSGKILGAKSTQYLEILDKLTKSGMSSDESDAEETNGSVLTHRIQKTWRSPHIDYLLHHIIDKASTRSTLSGSDKRGASCRTTGTPGTTASTKIVRGLPRNFYGTEWLNTLNDRQIIELQIKPPMILPRFEGNLFIIYDYSI